MVAHTTSVTPKSLSPGAVSAGDPLVKVVERGLDVLQQMVPL